MGSERLILNPIDTMLPQEIFDKALRVIQMTAGYAAIGSELAQMRADRRVRLDMTLEDRAQTSLLGVITLGPEAAQSSALSLAQTLVHEHFHVHQNPLQKTVSFWSGIASRTSPMARYERPAYRAAIDFLEAVKTSQPSLFQDAVNEQAAVRQVFEINFGSTLA